MTYMPNIAFFHAKPLLKKAKFLEFILKTAILATLLPAQSQVPNHQCCQA